MHIAIIIEKKPNSMLAGKDDLIILKTESCVLKDSPKLNWIRFLRKLKYWLNIDSLRPNLFLSRILDDWSAPDPNIASTGSPGAILKSINTSVEISHKLIGRKEILIMA